MKTRAVLAILLPACLMASTLACNLPIAGAQPPSPQPAQTQQQVQASPAPATAQIPQVQVSPTSAGQGPAGRPFSYQGVSFTIPQDLAGGAAGTLMPKIDDQSGPPWEVAPAYVKIVLQNYSSPNGNSFEPQVLVYPANEYAQVSAYGDAPAQAIKTLAAVSANPGAALPARLPFLPTFNAGQLFDAQTSVLKFQNGAGLRFLTEFGQDYGPVTSNSMIYTFQGLTGDGKYYIAVIFPAGAPFLDPGGESTPAVPDGGIPFDFNAGDHADYYKAMSDRLDITAPEVFMPSLAALDALVQSIRVVAP